MELWQLKQLQELPLEVKIEKSKQRIKEWYEYFNGDVYISFSGGKDSTVLLHLVRELYPNVEAVFCDTGLEYPEIKDFVKRTDNVTTIRPEIGFRQVIEKHGYPIFSKDIARVVYYARKGSNWAIHKLDGLEKDGKTYSEYKQRYKKYKYLLDAPFKISEKCCEEMKKKPFKKFEKETGKKPIIGTMASDGKQRQDSWVRTGCNAFNSVRQHSMPLSFWKESDVWDYLKTKNIPYSSIYDMGYLRTGCIWCGFGCHIEKGLNRFQRMKQTHPKLHSYCMKDRESGGLGLKEVLDFINIKTD